MIEFRGLCKQFGNFQAVQQLNFSVQRGEVFGFLGPNGAGKTTTIRMMMGILVPSQGQVLIDGLDCSTQRAQVQRGVGYLPDTPVFYDYLRGVETLRFVAEMHGMLRDEARGRATQMLAELGMGDDAQEFAVNYSLGMKKKLGLACALIHRPKVLILDEPINGLDPRAARDVQDRLLQFAAQGGTVFVSTHLLDMAEKLCTRVGIVHRGQLVAQGRTQDVVQSANSGTGGSLEEAFLSITEDARTNAEVGGEP